MKTVYFILGMHRSGTSALGGMLSIMGLDFGSTLLKADENNTKGYYENFFVYRVNEEILQDNGSSWDDYNFNIEKIGLDKEKSYINKIVEVLEQEYQFSENFVIKDPRICMLFPLWEKACLQKNIDIKVIIPYRNPIEVANSLKKGTVFHLKSLCYFGLNIF